MLHSGKFGCVTTFVMALNSNLKLKNVKFSQFKYVIHFLCSTLSKIQIHKICTSLHSDINLHFTSQLFLELASLNTIISLHAIPDKCLKTILGHYTFPAKTLTMVLEVCVILLDDWNLAF